MPASGDLPRLPPSGKPLITKRLAAWWALAAGVVVALVFVATDHMWRATGTLALTLLGAAVLRVVLPVEGAGGLVVRRTAIDVAMLVLLAVAVALIGFNLGGVATSNYQKSPWIATLTLATIVVIAVITHGLAARLSILIGVAVGYIAAAVAGLVDFSAVSKADWVGLPTFTSPTATWSVIPMFLPVVPNDYRPEKSPCYHIVNLQLTKTFSGGIELYGGVKNLLNFLPKNPILHADDPFDKPGGKYFDANGVARQDTNPNGYTFDPSYNYASMQGMKAYAGIRWQIK